MDTIATTRGARHGDHERITELGEIVHAIGGSAYNVASNLAQNDAGPKLKVYLFTVLPQFSAISQVFWRRMKEVGIDRYYVQLLSTLSERAETHVLQGGGYIGIVDGDERQVKHAIVHPPLEAINLFATDELGRKLTSAIKHARLVFSTCGLHPETILQIRRLCATARTPLFLTLGSAHEGYVNWLQPGAIEGKLAACVAGRLTTVCKMLSRANVRAPLVASLKAAVRGKGSITSDEVKEICLATRSRHLLLTDFDDDSEPLPHGRYAVLSALKGEGQFFAFDASAVVVKELHDGNTAGISDAALAGFLACYQLLCSHLGKRLSDFQIDLKDNDSRGELRSYIEHFVKSAVQSDGPTKNSLILTEENPEQQTSLAQVRRGLDQIRLALQPIRLIVNLIAGLFTTFIIAWILYFAAPWACHQDILFPMVQRYCN